MCCTIVRANHTVCRAVLWDSSQWSSLRTYLVYLHFQEMASQLIYKVISNHPYTTFIFLLYFFGLQYTECACARAHTCHVDKLTILTKHANTEYEGQMFVNPLTFTLPNFFQEKAFEMFLSVLVVQRQIIKTLQ